MINICLNCGNKVSKTHQRRNAKCCSAKCANERNKKRYFNPSLPISKGRVGAISELIASSYLLRQGYYVFRSVSQDCPCDLIVMTKKGELIRVEVKSGKLNKVTNTMSASFSMKRLNRNNFDMLIVVLEDGQIFLNPHQTS